MIIKENSKVILSCGKYYVLVSKRFSSNLERTPIHLKDSKRNYHTYGRCNVFDKVNDYKRMMGMGVVGVIEGNVTTKKLDELFPEYLL